MTRDTVLLQAMKEDPPLDAPCRDKFLVQSVLIDGSQEIDVASVVSIKTLVPYASILNSCSGQTSTR